MANGVVRVEKKRTNLIGLIIVFAVLIGAFCFGLYLLCHRGRSTEPQLVSVVVPAFGSNDGRFGFRLWHHYFLDDDKIS